MQTGVGGRVILLVFTGAFFFVGLLGALSVVIDESERGQDRSGVQYHDGEILVPERMDDGSPGFPRDVSLVMIVTGSLGLAICLVGYLLLMRLEFLGEVAAARPVR